MVGRSGMLQLAIDRAPGKSGNGMPQNENIRVRQKLSADSCLEL
jgi:hypothetical protein